MRANNTSYVYIIKFNSGEEENGIPRNGGGNLRNSGFSLCLCSTRLTPPPPKNFYKSSHVHVRKAVVTAALVRELVYHAVTFVYIVPAWDAAIKQKH